MKNYSNDLQSTEDANAKHDELIVIAKQTRMGVYVTLTVLVSTIASVIYTVMTINT